MYEQVEVCVTHGWLWLEGPSIVSRKEGKLWVNYWISTQHNARAKLHTVPNYHNLAGQR